MKYNKIAIIPARSGSKGLKDKNIISLCGKPLIAYSIIAAMESKVFSAIIVSTDSDEYARIAKEYGASVMIRDKRLATDSASTFVVVEDILRRYHEMIDYFVLLQPTSPMRNSVHIKEAVSYFEKHYNTYDFLVSVKEAEHAGVLVKPIDDDGSLKYFDTDFSNYKRQAFKEYSPNGAIFIGKGEEYLKQKHFFGNNSLAYKMNKKDSIDIDDELDLQMAKAIMEKSISKI